MVIIFDEVHGIRAGIMGYLLKHNKNVYSASDVGEAIKMPKRELAGNIAVRGGIATQ